MAMDFPSSPTTGQLYPNPAISGLPQYIWDGSEWQDPAISALAYTPSLDFSNANNSMYTSVVVF